MLARRQGCTFVNQYVVVQALGQGAYARVKLALHTGDQRLYALKLIRRRRPRASLPNLAGAGGARDPHAGGDAYGQPSQEARLMARLAHPNIVRLVEVIGARSAPNSWFVRLLCNIYKF